MIFVGGVVGVGVVLVVCWRLRGRSLIGCGLVLPYCDGISRIRVV